MAFFSLFKHKRESEAGVIFDIGSRHIGAALAVFSKKEPPTIIWGTRAPMRFQENIDFERFLNGMLETLSAVAGELLSKGIRNMKTMHGLSAVGEVVCVFSSPWYISQTKIVSIEKEKSFEVTRDFIGDILKKAQKQFQSSAELEKVRKKLGSSMVIENHVIETALNGYHTGKPYGKMARSVHASLFLSMISKEVAEKVKSTLGRTFNAREISFHSSALTSFTVVRDLFHTEENFLLVDVGGEVTDVSLVREGVLHETVSFPAGTNFLFRTIAHDLKTTPEEAHSLVRLSILGKGGGEDERFQISLQGAQEYWLSSQKHALEELGDGLTLPRVVFLSVDSDVEAWFRNILTQNDFSAYTLIEEPFSVVMIREQKLYEYCRIAPGVFHDPFLSVEALFLNRVLHSDDFVSI